MGSNIKDSEKDNPWIVLDYEVLMFLGTSHVRENLQGGNGPNTQIIRNSLVESSLLHIRILADIFLDRCKYSDDIGRNKLNINFEEGKLSEKIKVLADKYGNSRDENSNCWIINKRLAHPTIHRSDSYNYAKVFNSLETPLKDLIKCVYALKNRKVPFPFYSD